MQPYKINSSNGNKNNNSSNNSNNNKNKHTPAHLQLFVADHSISRFSKAVTKHKYLDCPADRPNSQQFVPTVRYRLAWTPSNVRLGLIQPGRILITCQVTKWS
jgi:hypothetical protein